MVVTTTTLTTTTVMQRQPQRKRYCSSSFSFSSSLWFVDEDDDDDEQQQQQKCNKKKKWLLLSYRLQQQQPEQQQQRHDHDHHHGCCSRHRRCRHQQQHSSLSSTTTTSTTTTTTTTTMSRMLVSTAVIMLIGLLMITTTTTTSSSSSSCTSAVAAAAAAASSSSAKTTTTRRPALSSSSSSSWLLLSSSSSLAEMTKRRESTTATTTRRSAPVLARTGGRTAAAAAFVGGGGAGAGYHHQHQPQTRRNRRRSPFLLYQEEEQSSSSSSSSDDSSTTTTTTIASSTTGGTTTTTKRRSYSTPGVASTTTSSTASPPNTNNKRVYSSSISNSIGAGQQQPSPPATTTGVGGATTTTTPKRSYSTSGVKPQQLIEEDQQRTITTTTTTAINLNNNNNNNGQQQQQQRRVYGSPMNNNNGASSRSNTASVMNGITNNNYVNIDLPTLKLVNPLKLQKIYPDMMERYEKNDNDNDEDSNGGYGGGGSGGRRRYGTTQAGGVNGETTTTITGYKDDGSSDDASRTSVADASQQQLQQPPVPFGRNQRRQRGGGGGSSHYNAGGGGGGGRNYNNNNNRNYNNNNNDGSQRNTGRTSLRIGGGRNRNDEAGRKRGNLKRRHRDRTMEKQLKEQAAIQRKTIHLPEGQSLSVSELAECIDEKPIAVIKFLMTDLGIMASMTANIDPSTCIAVATGFGNIVAGENDNNDDEDLDDEDDDDDDEDSALSTGYVIDNEEDDPASLISRPPVVTIMGHVDHGKTSLLDAIRNTDVTATEYGGITQHITSYQVKHNSQTITFIDTPGHAAFTDMRERGANITDMVILVVAADDGVKQQTADSISCARQSDVPIIVAINKCDLDETIADPMKVMTDLTQYDILAEELGGDVLTSKISAKIGTGIDDLLDKIMLQSELLDLKANPHRKYAQAVIVEAKVEKGLGTVATTLIQQGTLKVGDIFVSGETYGKVRALISTSNNKKRLKEAGPSTPVRVVGFEGIPAAGDTLVVAIDEQTARETAENRQRISRERSSLSYQDGLMSSASLTFGNNASNKIRKEMCVVVKADVQGTAEALTRSLRELTLENDEAIVTIKVLVSEAGEVNKNDVAIASVTPSTTILAFNVAASMSAMDDARIHGIHIEYYNIVYDAIESIQSRMQEVLSPTPPGEYSGKAIVQEIFNIGGLGNIAGCKCVDGMIRKNGFVRVMRGDKILNTISTTTTASNAAADVTTTDSSGGNIVRIKNLRSYKAETDTIEEGNDCGIALTNFETFEPGDIIECYVE